MVKTDQYQIIRNILGIKSMVNETNFTLHHPNGVNSDPDRR